MTERLNIAREVRRMLAGTSREALEVLPAFAGELLAGGDDVSISDLKDALGIYVFERGPNHAVADAVLAMVRTYTIGEFANFSH